MVHRNMLMLLPCLLLGTAMLILLDLSPLPVRYCNEIDRTEAAEAELQKAKAGFGERLWLIEEEQAAGARV